MSDLTPTQVHVLRAVAENRLYEPSSMTPALAFTAENWAALEWLETQGFISRFTRYARPDYTLTPKGHEAL
ncbi:hypothetical protein [Psychromicrobium lacuslunae]|uniref:MarR family transcriptional regulator n=1 Tax=Psychromicrobium lacuslunae TaxID=1618207 RepID=A0A0D4C1G5_9MICC|nr:hypothetical protein [Psychromicrobium lacuslunae]AJT42404.1 hypothetical protein UM93_14505 [Psychromicrobium lacuslunae]